MTSTGQMTVGILHPGKMGTTVAAELLPHAATVIWCPAGRSAQTRERAENVGLTAAESLAELLRRSDIVISLCTVAHAEDVAEQVAAHDFKGVYVEANAISPTRARRIAALLQGPGRTVVDAGVLGSPWVGTETNVNHLYLSGPESGVDAVAELFAGTAFRLRPLSDQVGAASALKLSYSLHQKVNRALVGLCHALAAIHGVQEELREVAAEYPINYLAEPEFTPKVAVRAWRWGPDLLEAAQGLEEDGLPGGLARAGSALMAHWHADRDRTDLSLETALRQLGSPDMPLRREEPRKDFPHEGLSSIG